MATLTVDRLCLRRGQRTLCANVSIGLQAGQWLELRGNNGCGKSTLLRSLLLHSSDSDAIFCDGRIAYFAQPFGLRHELTALEQLKFSSVNACQLSEQACLLLLKKTGLLSSCDIKVSHLSEGQRTRLALAQLLAMEADIWLMDEPLNTLDAAAVHLLSDLLQAHLDNGGVAVIATHHQLSEYFGARVQDTRQLLDLSASDTPPSLSTEVLSKLQRGNELKAVSHHSTMYLCQWLLKREWALHKASPKHLVWPAVFQLLMMSLFPFALGAHEELLQSLAPGLMWVSVLLSILLGNDALFVDDYASGWFLAVADQVHSWAPVVTVKILLTSGLQALSIMLVCVLSSIQFHLQGQLMGWLLLALLTGLMVLSLMGSLFAAMTLLAKRATLVVYLMALPLFVPVIIFGSSVTQSFTEGHNPLFPLTVLVSMMVLGLLLVPVLVGHLIRWVIE